MNWTIIKNEKEYNKAITRFEEIFDASPASSQSDEFDLLSLLISKYEEENFPIPEADPIEVIRMKMEYIGLSQKDLIPIFGSKATASKILAYKSPLTLKHVWLLSKKLNLPVGLLAKPYRVNQWSIMNKYSKNVKAALRAKG